MLQEYEHYDALGLATLVERGEVTPTELLETAIARTELRNPALNAVVTSAIDAAQAAIAAGLPAGPFRGVPFLVKELVVSVAGMPTTSASRLFADNMPSVDSEIVARYRGAGLNIFGKTNSSELGLSPATESALFGVTRNPWRTDLSPGGSSGGSASAVAAGIVPMAHATDGGGSIRIPASCCGLFGLKPTRGRITAGPEGGEGLAGLASQHAVTRSVRDSAALLDAVTGPMPGDPYAATPPDRPYLEEVGRDPGRLRIGFASTAPSGVPVDPACVEAVESVARLCAELGHHVESASPDYDASITEQAFHTVFAANTMANVGRRTGGRLPAPELVEPLTYALAQRGARIGAPAYIVAVQAMHRQARLISKFFENYDLWLTPTLTAPPRPIGDFTTDCHDIDAWLAKILGFIPFTYPFNMSGQPAASIPLYWTPDGLPIGCQFAARYGDEALLFRMAAQLELARPWFNRMPRLK